MTEAANNRYVHQRAPSDAIATGRRYVAYFDLSAVNKDTADPFPTDRISWINQSIVVSARGDPLRSSSTRKRWPTTTSEQEIDRRKGTSKDQPHPSNAQLELDLDRCG